MTRRKRWILGAVVPLVSCVAVYGLEQPKPLPVEDLKVELEGGQSPAAVTIDRMMEAAVRNIGIRYNLNDKQLEITRDLMRREVYKFLKENEDEVWPILRDMLASGFRPPNQPEDLKRLGQASRRLVERAKEAIFRANEEWRNILTPEQIEVHEFDMTEMGRTFEQMDRNLTEWEAGRPAEFFPQPNVEGEPPRPRKPTEVPAVQKVFDLNLFETLVAEFIKEYALDEGQITSANSILEEFKEKARDFKASKKEEFAKIGAERERAYEQADLEGIKKANTEHKKLLEPVFQLAAQMEVRLKGLLTKAQIERHAQKQKQAAAEPKSSGDSEPFERRMTPKKPASTPGPADPEPGSP